MQYIPPQNSTTQEDSVKDFIPSPLRRFTRPLEDSQISTSSDSSNTSSRNTSEDTRYPTFTSTKNLKTKILTPSLKDNDFLETPVAEEGEDQEVENQFLKRLPVFADGQEFNNKKTHTNRFRENLFSNDLNRCRSVEPSFLPLDSVEEDKNEEDLNAFKQRRRLRLQSLKMEDLNEFNKTSQNDRIPFERKGLRNLSLQMKIGKEVIVEEQENKALPHLQSIFGSHSSIGSRRGSGLITSPGTKLKVDELDFLDQKFDGKEEDNEEDSIDPIIEETEEKNGQTDENKEFQVAKAKMNEEKEFIKKVIKGDIIDEMDSVISRRSTEREFSYHGGSIADEIIEEDNNENIGN